MHLVTAGAQFDTVRGVDVAQTDGAGAAASHRLAVVGAAPFRSGFVLRVRRGDFERRLGLAGTTFDARRCWERDLGGLRGIDVDGGR
jgi:hypothetical protein